MIRMARPKAHLLPHAHETPEAGAGPEKAAENVNPWILNTKAPPPVYHPVDQESNTSPGWILEWILGKAAPTRVRGRGV